ncbi:hypothetical protein D3C71_18820 [compost metagenome]
MTRIRNIGVSQPVCRHYRSSGECGKLPTVRIFHGPKPADADVETREYSDVHEYCPHAGPQLPEWHWNQKDCSMYEVPRAAGADSAE